MKWQLAASLPVDETELCTLAQQRAEQMHGQFAGDGKLGDERVLLTEVDLTASDHEKVRSRLNITTLNKLRFPLALGLGETVS